MANLGFAKLVHNYLSEFVRAADQKAAFILVAATTLLGWLATRTFSDWRFWLRGIAMALATLSAALAACSVRPRQHLMRKGLIAFGGIADSGGECQYNALVSQLTGGGLQEIASHSYSLAKILDKKYKKLSAATWLLLSAIVAAFLVLVAGRPATVALLHAGTKTCGLKAELRGVRFPQVYNPNVVELRYVITNASDRDYEMPSTYRVLRKSVDGVLHDDVRERLGFQPNGFFPHGYPLEFLAGLDVGNLFDHSPSGTETAELEKQLTGTTAYVVIDEKYPCKFELPVH